MNLTIATLGEGISREQTVNKSCITCVKNDVSVVNDSNDTQDAARIKKFDFVAPNWSERGEFLSPATLSPVVWCVCAFQGCTVMILTPSWVSINPQPHTHAVPANMNASLDPVCVNSSFVVCSSVDLTTDCVYRIGRSVGADVTLRHTVVSRKHAAVCMNRLGGCFVIDLGSAQGTFLNAVKCVPFVWTRVRRGMMLR